MEAAQVATQMTPCGGPLPDLEVPMINTIVSCLCSEHRKLDQLTMQLALAATRLAVNPVAAGANQRAVEVWDDIRRDLWSHLQMEDQLVLSWGEAHQAISGALLDGLKIEHQEMRKLVAALPQLSSGVESESPRDRAAFAQTLLALARTLDSHIARYDGEVLPSILRALFRK